MSFLKKNPKADLEKVRGLFLRFGLVLSLSIVYLSLEYKKYDAIVYDSFNDGNRSLLEEEDIPITVVKPPPPPPPPPPKPVLKVVQDNIDIEDVEIADSEMSDEPIDLSDFQDDEEDVGPINFYLVENKPVWPGCEELETEEERFQCLQQKLAEHIRRNFRYPEIALEMGVEGRVVIGFTISKTGKINDVKPLLKIDKNLDKEAMRIINMLPQLKPAEQRGRAVPVSYSVPISFSIRRN